MAQELRGLKAIELNRAVMLQQEGIMPGEQGGITQGRIRVRNASVKAVGLSENSRTPPPAARWKSKWFRLYLSFKLILFLFYLFFIYIFDDERNGFE